MAKSVDIVVIEEKKSSYRVTIEGKMSLSEADRKILILGYDPQKKGPTFGERHVQLILMFLCMAIGFAQRTNLSVAIIAMTDLNSTNPDIPVYDWNNNSVILSSFYWGYVWLQILAGYLGKTYGPKYFLCTTFFINSIAFTIIPFAASEFGSTGVMICRIIQGVTQGFMFPSGHTMLGKWAPAEEMAFAGTLVYTGVSCGSVLSSIVTGYISSSSIGWPCTFYIFGGLGFGWCILFLIFGYDSPAVNPRITKDEKQYIEGSLGQTKDNQVVPTPWMSILTSIHFYAILIANIGNAWGYAMLMTEAPTYLSKVMGFELASTGVVSAVPYIVGSISGLLIAPATDYLVRSNRISQLNARRGAQFIGGYGQGICLILLTYAAKTKATSVIMLALANIGNAATLLGYSVNYVDLSPRFSGIMQAIGNTLSQIISIFSPLLVNFVVQDEGDASQWRIIFLVSAAAYFIAATFFVIFASVTRQKWDGPSTEAIDKMERVKKASVISFSGM